jgi:hypothetical protein
LLTLLKLLHEKVEFVNDRSGERSPDRNGYTGCNRYPFCCLHLIGKKILGLTAASPEAAFVFNAMAGTVVLVVLVVLVLLVVLVVMVNRCKFLC